MSHETPARRASRDGRAGGDGEARPASVDRSPWFMPLVFAGGLVFGLGLAVSHMARPEVVLDFLQFDDFGLLLVMAAGTAVAGVTFAAATRSGRTAPLTGRAYGLRVRELDSNVVVGGTVFGVGWGLSGICPGATYASLGVGNYPILLAIGGMFAGAYLHGYWRSYRAERAERAPAPASD